MALEKAFNQWWFYAKDDLMSDEDEMDESKIHNNMKQKQTIRITESKLRKMIKEAINEFDDEDNVIDNPEKMFYNTNDDSDECADDS